MNFFTRAKSPRLHALMSAAIFNQPNTETMKLEWELDHNELDVFPVGGVTVVIVVDLLQRTMKRI